jgi:hypothetical protein
LQNLKTFWNQSHSKLVKQLYNFILLTRKTLLIHIDPLPLKACVAFKIGQNIMKI